MHQEPTTARRYVRYETNDQGIAVVTIADPNDDSFVADKHPMHRELRDIFPSLEEDADVKAVVLVGGAEELCPPPSLANLRALLEHDTGAAERLQQEAKDIVLNMLGLSKPLIAGVSNQASGVGAQLAFSADFLVMARGTALRDTHVRIGLAAGDGATLVWPLSVGLPTARKHILTGAPLSAEEAHRLGAVYQLVDEPSQVQHAAVALAAKLGRSDAQAMAATKKALNGWLVAALPEVMDPVNQAQVESYGSPAFEAFLAAQTEAAK
jgi:enoyl-CoA hydratase